MGEDVRYLITVREEYEEHTKAKVQVEVTDCGPIDGVKSKTHNWKIRLLHPENWKTLMEIYTSGPIPTDFIDFGETILQELHFAQEERLTLG